MHAPDRASTAAGVVLATLVAGVPFVSDAELEAALDEAGVPSDTADAIVEENTEARVRALQVAFALLALFAVAALPVAGRLPTTLEAEESGERTPLPQ